MTTEVTPAQPSFDALFDFKTSKIFIDKMLDDWSEEITKTEERRKERKVDVDIKELRLAKKLSPDEMFIPDRVVDTNISREQPTFIQFLSQSKRLVIFRCDTDPLLDTQLLEQRVSEGFRYKGWLTQFFKVIDGGMLHGSDAMEVTFDESKPLHVAFEHIGHDNLYWDKDIEDPQNSERVIRRYPSISIMKLEEFGADTRFGFNLAQIKHISERHESPEKRREPVILYKVFFKFQGVVYIAWYIRDTAVTDWIKAPEKLRLGISEPQLQTSIGLPDQGGDTMVQPQPTYIMVPKDIDIYPIFNYVYKESEEPKLFDKVGRSFLDKYKQECSTAILSAFTTGLSRAANIYGSPEAGDETESQLRQLDTEIAPNKIYNKKINFWSPPYPDALVLNALNFLDVANANQAGQVDFAAMNRKDSRKSATEMSMSQATSETMKTGPISFYSEHLRMVFDFAWIIVQSQALQDKIFLAVDKSLLAQSYSVLPAGDVDYIQRTQDIVQMETDWPVIQTTGAATDFLCDLIKLKYPEKGDYYAALIRQGDKGKQLVQSLATLVQGTLSPEEVAQQPPERQQQLAALQQEVQAYLAPPKQ